MPFTTADVKTLRDATGAGMLDCKRALEATDGDIDAAIQWLREKGLSKAAERSDRANTQGAIGYHGDGTVAALVQLKCETDFVASSEHFKGLAKDLAVAVAAKGEAAVVNKAKEIDDLKLTLKENIEVGDVVRFEAADGNVIDSYIHVQGGRGVNGVLVELAGGDAQLAHDVAVHIGFARPRYLRRDDVPAADVERERATLETITRNEGKPEQAIPKIVDGRLNGFYKEHVLVEQAYVKDEKQTIAQLLGAAEVVRFAQITIG
jgi:elongation factor Ts